MCVLLLPHRPLFGSVHLGSLLRAPRVYSHSGVLQRIELFVTYCNDDVTICPIQAVHSTCGGRDALISLPTGGGKSLCYQLPAVASEGVAVGKYGRIMMLIQLSSAISQKVPSAGTCILC